MLLEHKGGEGTLESGPKKFVVLLEIEAYAKDGSEVLDSELWEEIEVEAEKEDEAIDKALAEFQKRPNEKRKPTGYGEIKKKNLVNRLV
jgi:hypothetical protein